MNARRPHVGSCSGCSRAAQLAYAVTLRPDRDGITEASCVGSDRAGLARTARGGRPVFAPDGCAMRWVKAALATAEANHASHALQIAREFRPRAGAPETRDVA
jgi:uncharacterized metal-binding protein